MPTQVSQLTHSDLSERLKNHLKDKDLSKKHKDILASRFHQIKSWGLQNYQKKPTDIDDFLKSIDEMIVSIGTPSLLPDYPSLAPEIAKIYGLLFKTVPSFKELLSEKKLRHNIVVKQNSTQLMEAKELLQKVLLDIYASIQPSTDNHALEAMIGNVLALYTFLKPEKGEPLEVPLFVNGMWEKELYTIDTLQLTPNWMGSPVIAYGLNPAGKNPPLLLFKGTSYPTDQGFYLQILADLNPFRSIGAYLFSIGKKPIKQWLQNAGGKARLYGTSLGGALCEHTVIHYPDLIDKVFAFNCPALMGFELSQWNRKKGPLPEVNIYCQERDLVGKIGLEWGKGWNVYKVFGPLESPNRFLAHVRCFLADEDALMLKLNPKADGNTVERWIFTFFRQLLSVPLFMIASFIWLIKIGIQKVF